MGCDSLERPINNTIPVQNNILPSFNENTLSIKNNIDPFNNSIQPIYQTVKNDDIGYNFTRKNSRKSFYDQDMEPNNNMSSIYKSNNLISQEPSSLQKGKDTYCTSKYVHSRNNILISGTNKNSDIFKNKITSSNESDFLAAIPYAESITESGGNNNSNGNYNSNYKHLFSGFIQVNNTTNFGKKIPIKSVGKKSLSSSKYHKSEKLNKNSSKH